MRSHSRHRASTGINWLFCSFAVLLLFSLAISLSVAGPSDSDEEIYDEDEFVGFVPKKNEKVAEESHTPQKGASPDEKQREAEEKAAEKLLEQTLQSPPPPRGYWLEGTFIGVIICYLVIFFFGRRKNQSLADSWLQSTSKFFASNFSRVGNISTLGAEDEENYDPSQMILKETHHVFKLKATGRMNCIGLQGTLNLKKRHDMFSSILNLFNKGQDTLVIDVLMEQESMEKFVFAVVKKKEEKKYRKAHEDILSFTGPAISPPGLPASLVVCTEIEELTAAFLTPEVLHTLKSYEDLFIRMHFSDQGVVSTGYRYTLSFEFKLPTNESDMSKLVTLTKMSLYYIDLVARTNLSKAGKQKSEANRAKAAEVLLKQTRQQREEAIQQKKLEKRQKEKEKLATMSPSEQAKFEEKMQKREMKKRQAKHKVTIG